MKRVISTLVVTAALTIAASALAETIVNSKHNLSKDGETYKSNTTEVCVFCHTPHNPAATRALWNRTNPDNTKFTLYTSGANMESDSWYVGNKKTLPADSPSLLCLSCHDGTLDLGAVKIPPFDASVTMGKLTAGDTANLTQDLSNDHPISLVYENVRQTIGTTLVASDTNTGKVGSLPLAKGVNLECNTCHNVHDNANPPFLRLTMTKSALCTECHVK